jgi:hypothetical protein
MHLTLVLTCPCACHHGVWRSGVIAALVLTLGGPDRLLPVGRAPGAIEQVQDNGEGVRFCFLNFFARVNLLCIVCLLN